MLVIAVRRTSSFVHCISLVSLLAWHVSVSRSRFNTEVCGFKDIMTVGFSEDRMQSRKML